MGKADCECFRCGIIWAANRLRLGANELETEAETTSRVAFKMGNIVAAAILRSWANGLEIDAENRSGVHKCPNEVSK